MKSYLIDEIPGEDMDRAVEHLRNNGMASSLERVFWVTVPEDLLSKEQYSHKACCGPHVFAVELGSDWIKMEFFIRSLNNLRCTCNAYATREQRAFIFRFGESFGVRS